MTFAVYSIISPNDLPQWCYSCGENGSYRERKAKTYHKQYVCEHCGAVYKFKINRSEGNGISFHKGRNDQR